MCRKWLFLCILNEYATPDAVLFSQRTEGFLKRPLGPLHQAVLLGQGYATPGRRRIPIPRGSRQSHRPNFFSFCVRVLTGGILNNLDLVGRQAVEGIDPLVDLPLQGC